MVGLTLLSSLGIANQVLPQIGNIFGSAAQGAAGGSTAGLVGAGLGAATGIAGGIYQTVQYNKMLDDLKEQQQEYEKEQERQLEKRNYLDSVGIAKNTNLRGNQVEMQMYAFGNNNIAPVNESPELVNENGIPLSSSGVQIVGKPHELGGVDVPGSNAEVEGGEVLDNGMVFSNRIPLTQDKTFADFAKDLESQKAKNEKEMVDTNDRFHIETLERRNEIIDTKLAKLFKLQGIVKQSLNL